MAIISGDIIKMSEVKSEISSKEVEFAELVLGLSSAALHYLGQGHGGDVKSKSKETNMVLARQNIDIIRMLKVKTTGNLSTEESKMVDAVLTDLMMKFHQLKGE